jgi:glyoxylase-like metal-dependent hydrolase (beta-lactamase superfamily II)
MDNGNIAVHAIRRNRFTIHCCSSPDDGEGVNAQIIETANSLVIVDTLLLRPYARQLRDYARRLGKPINRVFITHAHPDHWFGLEYFQDVDTFALEETIEEIKVVAKASMDFHAKEHGDKITDKVYLPAHAVNGIEVLIDGLTFGLHKIVNAEDSRMLVIDLPEEKTLIAQDLVYNKYHLFVGQPLPDGALCFDGWLHALERFKAKGYELVLPGHGMPGDGSLFDDNINYLRTMRDIVRDSNGGNFIQHAQDAFPEHRLRLMLDLSAFFLYPA